MSSNTHQQDVLGGAVELEPFPLDAVENVDLGLPQEYLLDIMAAELLEHLAVYQKLVLAERAARHSGDYTRVEQMSKQILYSRVMAAMIQRDYPGAKSIADDLAKLGAKQAALQRAALLEA